MARTAVMGLALHPGATGTDARELALAMGVERRPQPPGRQVVTHLPARPSWDCERYGRPWPCDPAREDPARRYDRIQLAVYAWDRLEEAVGELPPAPSAELFDRIVRWTR